MPEFSADLVIHVAGVALALVGSFKLLNDAVGVEAYGRAVYCLGLTATLTISALYNVFGKSSASCWFRRCDHATIFLMIAASCTPFAVVSGDAFQMAGLALIWVIAFIGAAIKLLLPGRHERLMIASYLALGWGGLALLATSATTMPGNASLYLALGVALYSLGVIFHVRGEMKFSNAIWHGFVLAGAASHYFAVVGTAVAAG